ncbi:MAG: 2'-5' RNA ligase family protein [Caldilineaceae bacterium]
MPRYGVYLIPAADHPLFRLGSDFLGYNIWTEEHATPLLADTVGEETIRGWIGNAKVFSFHITIADCLEYRDEDVDEIHTRLQWIAQRMAPFTLFNGRFFDDFHSTNALTLTYESPDRALQQIHRLVVTLISVLHNASPYFGHLHDRLDATHRRNLIRYGAPWVLDQFWPHWSLATSVPDAAAWQRLRDETVRATGLLQTPETQSFTVDSIQLVALKEDGFYRIAGTYPFGRE